jgi:hypothetical protein
MMTQGVLTSYRFIFVPAALGVLLPTLFLPWIVINLLGLTPFSPIDIVSSVIWQDDSKLSDQKSRFDLQNFISSYQDTFVSVVASMVMYIASIIGMAVAITFRRHRSTIALSAGILAISASLLWFYSIESLKHNFAQQAAMTGGIIGEEFKGHERSLADLIIGLGMGPYVALAGGAIGTLTFITNKASTVKI